MVKTFPLLLLLAPIAVAPAFAQTTTTPASSAASAPASAAPATAAADDEPRPFRFSGEVKFNVRNSRAVQFKDEFPFPPSFLPPGQDAVYFRTVAPKASMEVSNLALIGEGDLTRGVSAKVEIHFLDLYNRNPTSSDDRFFIREAWVRFGRAFEPLQPVSGTSVYVQVGQAPRFTKPKYRRLESYGLWTTAVGRFENPQIQAGGTVGQHVYWHATVGNGNPVFMRDPNALAGDNGTPERVPGDVHPIYESGFPILYDAKPQDLNPTGTFEHGLGAGYRVANDTWAIDAMAWYFRRDLAPTVNIRGTYYSGDIKLLVGPGAPLPFSGNDKLERGVNVDARAGGLRIWGQYVDQEIAKLPRRGFEVETAYQIPLDGLFLVGETPIGQWIQPVLRLSHIDNRFTSPVAYPAPSFDWDWTKIDLGVRVGLTSHVDFTYEYNINNVSTLTGTIHPNESLATLRIGF